MQRLITILLFVLAPFVFSFGQVFNTQLNKQAQITLLSDLLILHHNSILPSITIDSSLRQKLNIAPIFTSVYEQGAGNAATVQVGVRSSYSPSNNWIINITAADQLFKLNNPKRSKFDTLDVAPHTGYYFSKNSTGNYHTPLFTGNINWMPTKNITISSGFDKHFLGHGYRSFFLSDNAPAFGFLNSTFNVWKIKYLAMLSYIPDVYNFTLNKNRYPKYGIFHYLSYEATKHIEFSFFESIISGGNDSSYYRSLEPSYLNPFIFMRPVEYAMASPDNVNLGFGVSIRLNKNSRIYSQFMIDEYATKYAFKKNWWGNKYALQIGIKLYNILTINNLYCQLEYNQAQPYTYAHRSGLTNYGYNLHPLAHPLGANFKELIFVLQYQKNKWIANTKTIYAEYGADNNYNAGNNIYKSYNNRLNTFNVYIGQGINTKQITSEIKLIRIVNPKYNMQFEFGGKMYAYIYHNTNLISPAVFFGFRTLLYNIED